MYIWRLLCALSTAALFFAGCVQFPQQSVNDAKTALDAAKKAEANKYAPSQMQAAQVSYELAKKELMEESRKMPFVRKYIKIIETLKSAQSAAESALSATETAKNQLTAETQDQLARAQAVVDTVDSIIVFAKARKKNTDSLLSSLSMDLDSLNAKIRDAGAVFGSGDLLAAKKKALLADSCAQALAIRAATFRPNKKKVSAKK